MMTKTFKITIGILVLLALAAGGVLGISRSKRPSSALTGQGTPSSAPSARFGGQAAEEIGAEEVEEITAGDIDTSSWKTYRNEEYGFSFKYPPEYGEAENKILQGTTGTAIGISFSDNDLRGGITSVDYSVGHGIPLWIFASGHFQYSEGKCQYGPGEPDKMQTVVCAKIKNSAGISAYFAKATSGEGGDKVIAGFIPLINNITYRVFILENSSINLSSENQLKKILSTFRFAN